MTTTKHIGILCGYPFPEGMAATNRILAYSKGLVESGIEIDVFIFNPIESDILNSSSKGTIGKIRYHYPSTRGWSNYKFIRIFFDRIGAYILTYYNILHENRKNRFNYIFISSDLIHILIFFVPLIKFLGLKIVFITDEYPKPIRVNLKSKIPIAKRVMYSIILRPFCAMIFMTNNLSNFYGQIIYRPSFILPTIIDFSRFDKLNLQPFNQLNKKYICYMGNLELSKDNVDNIIQAFNLLKNRYKDIDFYIYGNPSNKDLNTLISLINSLDISDRVFLKGRVNFDEVPHILFKAYILVSSQPDTKRAEGGFPTKLGEYMAAGRPVLLTNVGEISLYIKDNHNAFLCPPCDPIAYADKLHYIIENYSASENVGNEGRNYVRSYFSSNIISKSLISFLDGLQPLCKE